MKLTIEQRGLVMMRKVLSSVIRDATPRPGDPHPLSQETLDDIRSCLGFIVTREKALMSEAGVDDELSKPHFIDEPKPQKVNFDNLKK